jgi:hypothetical protein
VGTALVLALAGCSDEPEEVARTSGALADGFEIEPGSGLVGGVFPLVYGVGHQAVLRVDGDLPEVFEGYVRQAEELGYPMESWPQRPEGQWCTDSDDATDDEPSEGPFEVECTAFTVAPEDSSVSVRGLADADGGGYIHLRVQPSFDTDEPAPLASDGPVASATDDESAAGLTPYEEPPVRLVEGSELVSEPFPATCITGGYVAVLRVTDDLVPVMRGYEEQFAAMRAFTTEGLAGDDDALLVWASAAGGGTLSALGVAGDPSHVLIERCND